MAGIVRIGDSTTHGGTVITTRPTAGLILVGGAPAAVQGDMHSCPMTYPGSPPPPHAVTPFPTGKPTVLIGGIPALTTDDVCICGAKAIPTDPTITIG